jgi:hypothetical protein
MQAISSASVHALPFTMLLLESSIAAKSGRLKITILYPVYHKLRLDLGPKLTESNQNSEFGIGSGSDPTKNMVWIRGGTEKMPTGQFGLDFMKALRVEIRDVQWRGSQVQATNCVYVDRTSTDR